MAFTFTNPTNGQTLPSPVTLTGVLDDGNTNNVELQIEEGATILEQYGFTGVTADGLAVWTFDEPFVGTTGITYTARLRRRIDSNPMYVLPHETGCRIDTASLAAFPAANDGANANVVDAAFLAANTGAAWRAPDEGGVPVISGALIPRGLRLATQVILRDCEVSSSVRAQPATWGFPQNDAPVILMQAANTVIEHCTVYGTGFDDDISSRGMWVAGANCLIEHNDISGVRGAVQMFTGTSFRRNYCHDYAFGWQADRDGNFAFNGEPDEVTHNNAIGNLGYHNCLTEQNYLDNRYGRVSALAPGHPSYAERLTPLLQNSVYNNGAVPGEVVIGDPIDGFTFANYLQQDDGTGFIARDNFCRFTGRPLLSQTGEDDAAPVAAADFSRNIFADYLYNTGFNTIANAPVDGSTYTLVGSCNQEIDAAGTASVFGSGFFNNNAHGTAGCTLVDWEDVGPISFTIGAASVTAMCRRI